MQPNTTHRLADKASDMLEQALHDLRVCENSLDYKINMQVWHEPDVPSLSSNPTVCEVCMAGATMSLQLGLLPYEKGIPNDFDTPTMVKLHSINDFRLGALRRGVRRFHGDYDPYEPDAEITVGFELPEWVDVVAYEDDPSLFKEQMRSLVKKLRDHGY